MWKYLRFAYIHWIWIPLSIVGFLLGGAWTWFGYGFLFIVGVGGELLTASQREENTPVYDYPIIHDLII